MFVSYLVRRLVSLKVDPNPEADYICVTQLLGRACSGIVAVSVDRLEHLFAAAADVFPEEPLPANSPLLKLENFVMTPHIAGGTRQAAEKAAVLAAAEVRRFLSDEPLLFCANPETQVSHEVLRSKSVSARNTLGAHGLESTNHRAVAGPAACDQYGHISLLPTSISNTFVENDEV